MPNKIAISLVRLVIIIMTFECMTAAFVAGPAQDSGTGISIHSNKNTPSLLNSFVFEKAEEEERNEAETNRFLTVELADFSRIAFHLSEVHTHHLKIDHHEQVAVSHPGMFKLFRVLII